MQIERNGWDEGTSALIARGPGESTFSFDDLVFGVMLSALPSHVARYDDDVSPRPRPLRPGAGWLVPPGHSGYCAWQDESKYLNIALNKRVYESALSHGAKMPETVMVRRWDDATISIAMALHKATETDPLARLSKECLSFALAARILTPDPEAAPAPAAGRAELSNVRIRRVLELVEETLDGRISLAQMADTACLSVFHFAKLFKRATGLSPNQYVINRRIARAKLLLASSTLNVSEIAWQVGFGNVSHFNALFRRETGMTPRQYKSLA